MRDDRFAVGTDQVRRSPTEMTSATCHAAKVEQSGTLPNVTVEDFAARLRELRSLSGLTQAQLAEAMNMSIQAIQSWEDASKTPRPRSVIKLARALRADVNELLQLLGYEQVDVTGQTPGSEYWSQLEEIWSELTSAQRRAFIALMESIITDDAPEPASSHHPRRPGMRVRPGSGEVPDPRNDRGSSGDV